MEARAILVVEDDENLSEALAHTLRLEGYEPIVRPNGEAALDYLRGNLPPPDLILLDLMMPMMDGVRFRSEQVKDVRLRGVPVVIVSARLDTPRMATRLELPYLTKPFDAGVLLDTVRRYTLAAG